MEARQNADVLVIGAGPAGSAAARVLARTRIDVMLVDQRGFPRDKVCGDALISDSLEALAGLGIRQRVLDEAVQPRELQMYSPNGVCAPLVGEFACLARERFDALLLDAAIESGARFVAGMRAVAPLEEAQRVVGARFERARMQCEIRARTTILATGSDPGVLRAFGFAPRAKPAGVAGRAYYEAPAELVARFSALMIGYHHDWCPGYGWVFPGAQNRFNIGVGLFGASNHGARLHEFWSFFRNEFPPARELMARSRELARFRGAPLRTGALPGPFGRPGLLLVGEAADTTYPATGEGIGKAMQSGVLAAEMLAEAAADGRSLECLYERYGAEFQRRYGERYKAYRTAQSWAHHPLLLDLLAARASREGFVRRELQAFIGERGDARALFSKRGLLKALTR